MEIDLTSVDTWERFQEDHVYPKNIDICNLTTDVKVISRIGSPSVEGEVYKVQLRDLNTRYFAMKIMPLTNFESSVKNANEIEIASLVSGRYFPRVYGYKRCENIIFNFQTSNFYDSSIMFAYADHVASLIPKNHLKRFKALFKLGRFQSIEDYYLYLRSIGYDNWDLSVANSSADVMLSELAWGDLATYITMFKINLKDVVDQVREALYDLHYKFHVKHNDLHPGNILIKNVDPLQLMIHDFGKSSIYTDVENTEYYYEQDLNFFLDKFDEFYSKYV